MLFILRWCDRKRNIISVWNISATFTFFFKFAPTISGTNLASQKRLNLWNCEATQIKLREKEIGGTFELTR